MNRNNTEPYLSTYLHSKGRALGLPIGGNFELTARCNFSCPMCYVHLSEEDSAARGREISAEEWIELAREAKDMGMVFALITGGEPFIRKDFFEIYGAMKEMGILVSINTNGSMLSGEIRKKLIENPPFRVNVSLYGGCSETYKKMCGKEAFDTVLENIKALKEAGIDVRINLSVTQHNKEDIEKIYRISKELGTHIKASSYMYPPVRVSGEKIGCGNRLSPAEAAKCSFCWDRLRFEEKEFEQRTKNIVALVSAEEERDCPMEPVEGVGCRAGSSAFWITWDGKMLPCGMMPEPAAYPLEVGFEKAWETIKKKTAEIRLPAECSVCSKRPVCPVCAAVCVTETGSFDKVPDYVCKMTSETIRAYREREKSHGD